MTGDDAARAAAAGRGGGTAGVGAADGAGRGSAGRVRRAGDASAPCEEEVLARVAWNIVAEPGDATAGAVVSAVGARAALAWAVRAVRGSPADGVRRLRALVRDVPPPGHGAPVAGVPVAEVPVAEAPVGEVPVAGAPVGEAPVLGVQVAEVPVVETRVVDAAGDGPSVIGVGRAGPGGRPAPAGVPAPEVSDERWLRVVGRALERWAPRFEGLDPAGALAAADAVGAVVVVPGSPAWPRGLDDLGPAAPLALWVRGPRDLAALLTPAVAVVGARAATVYGRRVASDLAAGLAVRGATVVSGGAFGIDVAAHRAVLAAGGTTVALLAGGIDRPSPAGNLDVLEAITSQGGALVAESPPGSTPTRSRFLQRNRLIAAGTSATVVVEAAWRSGALSTAARAAELLRPVGAVPGPVTSMASAGCHRLLREGSAVCVTSVDDVLELIAPLPAERRVAEGSSAGKQPSGLPGGRPAAGPPFDPHPGPDTDARIGPAGRRHPSPTVDRADSVESRVLDAVPRAATGVPDLARRAGLAVREVQSALGLLELRGLVERAPGGWRRVPASRRRPAGGG